MTSLITLPIRLPLEITYRAAKLGIEVLRTVSGLLERDEADQRAAWPVEQEPERPAATETVIVPEPPEPVTAPVDFDAPGDEELAPPHVDSEPELSYEAGPAHDVGAEV